jgi:hypothetical protein
MRVYSGLYMDPSVIIESQKNSEMAKLAHDFICDSKCSKLEWSYEEVAAWQHQNNDIMNRKVLFFFYIVDRLLVFIQ